MTDDSLVAPFSPIIPINRRVFPSLLASQLVGVQPMSDPTGNVFSWHFIKSKSKYEKKVFYKKRLECKRFKIKNPNWRAKVTTSGITIRFYREVSSDNVISHPDLKLVHTITFDTYKELNTFSIKHFDVSELTPKIFMDM